MVLAGRIILVCVQYVQHGYPFVTTVYIYPDLTILTHLCETRTLMSLLRKNLQAVSLYTHFY